MRVGILTGGGDCPGLNAVLRGFVLRHVREHGHEALGFELGWKGVLEDRARPLAPEDVESLWNVGGTILRTSRTNPYKVEGGVDAKAFTYWLDRNKRSADDLDPYAVSHLGFGLHPHAHWDQILLHGNEPDRLDSSARVFAGNFLFSTGPNNDMGGKRDTKGHIDTPMCDCTVLLDNEPVLERGKFVDPKMIVPPAWG